MNGFFTNPGDLGEKNEKSKTINDEYSRVTDTNNQMHETGFYNPAKPDLKNNLSWENFENLSAEELARLRYKLLVDDNGKNDDIQPKGRH